MAGNAAVRRALSSPSVPVQRDEASAGSAHTRSDPTPGLAPIWDPDAPSLDPEFHGDPAAQYTAVVTWVAANVVPGQLHHDLTTHYVFGRGADFIIPADQMDQVFKPGQVSDSPTMMLDVFKTFAKIKAQRAAFVNELYGDSAQSQAPAADAATSSEPTPASSTPAVRTVELTDQASVGCNLPSLGTLQVKIRGTLTVAIDADERATADFVGWMTFYDFWNFDPRIPDPRAAPTETSRPWTAEVEVMLSHKFCRAFRSTSLPRRSRSSSRSCGATGPRNGSPSRPAGELRPGLPSPWMPMARSVGLTPSSGRSQAAARSLSTVAKLRMVTSTPSFAFQSTVAKIDSCTLTGHHRYTWSPTTS